MSDCEYSCAGSLYAYDTIEDLGYKTFDTTYSTWGYIQNQRNNTNSYEQSPIESLVHHPQQWPSTDSARQSSVYSQHLSASSFSSGLPSYRSSDNSSFSQAPLRDSISSSTSGYSQTSEMSRNQHLSLAEYLLCHRPVEVTPHAASSVDKPYSRSDKGKANQNPTTQEKDYFKTCVSGSKQSRLCSKKYKFFCTSCERPFIEKADWKRHEETYQERPEMFQCDLCPAIYFLEKDFTRHHSQSHRCTSCSEITRSKKAHATSARRKRMVRTGWGCGFCCHFSTDWNERCDHIARHMEKEGLTKANWYHTKVIHSLLQRPAIYQEWMRLLHTQLGLTNYGWNQHSTRRVEGYPESNSTPQLQDYLEYFTLDQDAAALAQLAYSKIVKSYASSRVATPPPVPPKDYPHVSLRDWNVETYPWAELTDSVVEDGVLPVGVSHLDSWYAG